MKRNIIKIKNPFKKEVKKTYADYVAPFNTIKNNLMAYVEEQSTHIEKQEAVKHEIELDIKNSKTEIESSKKTIDKIGEIVV